MVPDLQGSQYQTEYTFKMSVALKFMITLQNLTTNQRKSGEGICLQTHPT